MSVNPWMKFYPRDWRGDQALRAVTLTARGLWMEMLCIMHEASPYGHLVLGGQAVSNDVLARMAGTSVDEVSAMLIELESAGVLSRTRKGVIYSRRMVKDRNRAEKGRKAVNRRWDQGAENPREKQQPNRSANSLPTTQKPEARYSDAKASGDPPPDLLKSLFDLGVSMLVATGHPEGQARSIVGKWRKGRKDADVLQAVIECQGKGISNPVEWIPKRLGSACQPSFSDHIRRKYAA